MDRRLMDRKMELFDVVHGDVSALKKDGKGGFGFDTETRLVRYVSADRYLDMIEARCGEGDGLVKGCNELSLVTRWDDPYEACLLRANGASDASEGMKGLCESIQDYYGQCWMVKERDGTKGDCCSESDVLWRAYCPNKDGVRIETTVGALLASVKDCLLEREHDADAGEFLCLFGSVTYDFDTLKKMVDDYRRKKRTGNTAEAIARSLFVKREQFFDEWEVRIVLQATAEFIENCKYEARGKLAFEHGGCRMRGVDFMKRVLLDPRMPRHRAEEIICRTRIALGIGRGDSEAKVEIGRSMLYDWQEFTNVVREGIGEMANAGYKLWMALQKEYPHDAIINFKNRAVPTRSYWTGLPCGESGCCFAFTCCRTATRIELYLGKKERAENKRLFKELKTQEDAIKRQLRSDGVNADEISFDELEDKIASRISVRYGNVTSDDLPEKQSEIVKWFCAVMPPFARVMKEMLARVGMAMHEQG